MANPEALLPFAWKNRQTNKQTNPPTNQPTNKPTNKHTTQSPFLCETVKYFVQVMVNLVSYVIQTWAFLNDKKKDSLNHHKKYLTSGATSSSVKSELKNHHKDILLKPFCCKNRIGTVTVPQFIFRTPQHIGPPFFVPPMMYMSWIRSFTLIFSGFLKPASIHYVPFAALVFSCKNY